MSIAAAFFTALSGGVAGSAALMKPSEVRPGVWRTMGALSAVSAGIGLGIGVMASPAAGPSQGLIGAVVGVAVAGAAGALARPGRVAQLSLTVCALAAATALVLPLLSPATESAAGRWFEVPAALTAMAVLGAALASMTLGHWYLVGEGMPLAPYKRLAAAYGIAVILRIITLIAGFTMLPDLGAIFGSAEAFLRAGGVGLCAVVAFGMILPPILAVGARSTLRIPNTQATTGLLYVACIAAIIAANAAGFSVRVMVEVLLGLVR